MKNLTKSFQTISITAALLIGPGVSSAAPQESTSKLLTANFEARKIVKIEAGDFHFLPGQVAPIHTHAAPAIGQWHSVKTSSLVSVSASACC